MPVHRRAPATKETNTLSRRFRLRFRHTARRTLKLFWREPDIAPKTVRQRLVEWTLRTGFTSLKLRIDADVTESKGHITANLFGPDITMLRAELLVEIQRSVNAELREAVGRPITLDLRPGYSKRPKEEAIPSEKKSLKAHGPVSVLQTIKSIPMVPRLTTSKENLTHFLQVVQPQMPLYHIADLAVTVPFALSLRTLGKTSLTDIILDCIKHPERFECDITAYRQNEIDVKDVVFYGYHPSGNLGGVTADVYEQDGRTHIETVRKHYFDLDFEFMVEMVANWSAPTVHESDGNADAVVEGAIN